MAERIVIDASVAIALVRREPQRSAIRQATERWAEVGAHILAPSHFWMEVVNVLIRRYSQSEAEVVEALAALDQLGIETIELDRPTLLLALAPMSEAGLSAYDALYLALAISTESILATLDRRLAETAESRAILFADGGPRRRAETPLEYRRDPGRVPAWVRAATVGAHIAELRRSVLAAQD